VITTTTDAPVELGDRPGPAGPWLQIVGIVAVLAAAVMARRLGWTWEAMRQRVGGRGRRGRHLPVLPAVDVRPLEVDVPAGDAGRRTRTAIVACWQLELDAATGLLRRPAGPSMEYVERVAAIVHRPPLEGWAALTEARFAKNGTTTAALSALDVWWPLELAEVGT
jgi:hypothetical protein